MLCYRVDSGCVVLDLQGIQGVLFSLSALCDTFEPSEKASVAGGFGGPWATSCAPSKEFAWCFKLADLLDNDLDRLHACCGTT